MDEIDAEATETNKYNIEFKYFLIFLCTAFFSIVVTVVQIMLSYTSSNYIYIAACSVYGPLHFLASVLALSISRKHLTNKPFFV